MNYRLDIVPAQNGWIVSATFEGRTSITKVFNEQKELVLFIDNLLPMLTHGYNETLKTWIAFNNANQPTTAKRLDQKTYQKLRKKYKGHAVHLRVPGDLERDIEFDRRHGR